MIPIFRKSEKGKAYGVLLNSIGFSFEEKLSFLDD